MNFFGFQDTSVASMGHDQVLGTADDANRVPLMEDVAFFLKQTVISVPGQSSSHREAGKNKEKGLSCTVQTRAWPW